MRTALRLLEQQEYQLAALRHAVEEGESSGESNLTLKDIATTKKVQRVQANK